MENLSGEKKTLNLSPQQNESRAITALIIAF